MLFSSPGAWNLLFHFLFIYIYICCPLHIISIWRCSNKRVFPSRPPRFPLWVTWRMRNARARRLHPKPVFPKDNGARYAYLPAHKHVSEWVSAHCMLRRQIAPGVLTNTHTHTHTHTHGHTKRKDICGVHGPQTDRQWTACRKIACPLCILDVFICPGHSRSSPECFDLIYCRIHEGARKNGNALAWKVT